MYFPLGPKGTYFIQTPQMQNEACQI